MQSVLSLQSRDVGPQTLTSRLNLSNLIVEELFKRGIVGYRESDYPSTTIWQVDRRHLALIVWASLELRQRHSAPIRLSPLRRVGMAYKTPAWPADEGLAKRWSELPRGWSRIDLLTASCFLLQLFVLLVRHVSAGAVPATRPLLPLVELIAAEGRAQISFMLGFQLFGG